MTAREYPVFTVTPKAERSLRAGHPWVYGEEVTAVEGAYQNGDMVDVVSNKGRYLGTGWVITPKSGCGSSAAMPMIPLMRRFSGGGCAMR